MPDSHLLQRAVVPTGDCSSARLTSRDRYHAAFAAFECVAAARAQMAHTCFNRLEISPYDCLSTFEEKLHQACEMGGGSFSLR